MRQESNHETERATRPLGRGGSTADQVLANLPACDECSNALDLEWERAILHRAAEQFRAVVSEQTWDTSWLTSIDGLSVTEVAERLKIRPANVYVSRSVDEPVEFM